MLSFFHAEDIEAAKTFELFISPCRCWSCWSGHIDYFKFNTFIY